MSEVLIAHPWDLDKIPANIRDGVEIDGVVGTYTGGGGTFVGSNRQALILNEIRYVGSYTDLPQQYCGMYENSTYARYFWYWSSLPYNSGGNGSIRAIKITKSDGTNSTITSGDVYATSSGGTHVYNTIGTMKVDAGICQFLISDDGKITYDTATDTRSSYSYGYHSHNKTATGTDISTNKYTNINGLSVRINTIPYSTGGAADIQTVFELQ